MLMPVVLSKCMELSSCYYIIMIASIVLLSLRQEALQKFAPFIFLNIGILLAYFDFLTYPIATFGVPSAIYLLLTNEKSLKNKMADMIRNGFSWLFGYAGMWSSKWIMASIFTRENVISDAINAIKFRTAGVSLEETYQFGKIACISMNIKAFFNTPVSVALIIVLLYMIYRCSKHGRHSMKTVAQTMIPYLVLSLAPMVWYVFATSYSGAHYWFTNKACVVSVVAILFGLAELEEDAVNQPVRKGSSR